MVEAQKRFEIKKWNAVALWAWGKASYFKLTLTIDIHVDNCAICRNHIMDPCTIQDLVLLNFRHRVSSSSGPKQL